MNQDRRIKRWARRWLIAGLAVLTLAGLGIGTALATLTPSSATLTVQAGSSATEAKTVDVPATPPIADIEIAIDTTGSMGASIAQAKADATGLVSAVQASVPSAQFAVVQFRDPDVTVMQPLTANAASVQAAINTLSAFGGGDAPEAYNLVFHDSYTPATGGPIGWRTGSRKFVVVIGDAQPHGAGAAGLAGCTDTTADPNGLNTATELAGMAGAQRTLFMIRQASTATASLACYQSLAAGAFAGGQGVDSGVSLATQIVSLINAATSTVTDVHLEVASATPAPAAASWISFTPASAGPVTAPGTVGFTLTATVPPGTPPGSYSFDIVALADGADIGHQALTVVVPTTDRPPDCSGVTASKGSIKKSKKPFETIKLSGAVDPEGGAVTLVVDAVTQDEPVKGPGFGNTSPDAVLSTPPSSLVKLRPERASRGDGRVYQVGFTATDEAGLSCTGTVPVGVPNRKHGPVAIDSAPPSYDSLLP